MGADDQHVDARSARGRELLAVSRRAKAHAVQARKAGKFALTAAIKQKAYRMDLRAVRLLRPAGGEDYLFALASAASVALEIGRPAVALALYERAIPAGLGSCPKGWAARFRAAAAEADTALVELADHLARCRERGGAGPSPTVADRVRRRLGGKPSTPDPEADHPAA